MHADLRSHCAIDDQWSVIDNYGRSQATFLCSLLAFSDFLSETFDFLDYWMFDPWSILIQLNTLYTAIITIHLTTSSKKKFMRTFATINLSSILIQHYLLIRDNWALTY